MNLDKTKDKNFIRFTEDNSKKSIKVISNDLYQRLLQNNPKLDILEKSSSAGNIHEDLMNSKSKEKEESDKKFKINSDEDEISDHKKLNKKNSLASSKSNEINKLIIIT